MAKTKQNKFFVVATLSSAAKIQIYSEGLVAVVTDTSNMYNKSSIQNLKL